jgi:hypothetical protein
MLWTFRHPFFINMQHVPGMLFCHSILRMPPMPTSPPPPADELEHLRQLIAGLAALCGVDSGDRRALRQLIDAPDGTTTDDLRQELRTLLTLLYRLEAASSEDSGLAGLRRLWQLCAEARARLDDPCCSR